MTGLYVQRALCSAVQSQIIVKIYGMCDDHDVDVLDFCFVPFHILVMFQLCILGTHKCRSHSITTEMQPKPFPNTNNQFKNYDCNEFINEPVK